MRTLIQHICYTLSILLLRVSHYFKQRSGITLHNRIDKVEYKERYNKASVISPSKLNDKRNFVKNLTE